jgi:hypothetical protein
MTTEPADALPKPEVYFYPERGCYYIRDNRGAFIQVNETSLKRHLKAQGMSRFDEPDGGPGVIDRFLNETQTTKNVFYATPLAGHTAGERQTRDGARFLVTNSPYFIKEEQGEWHILEAVIRGLLVPDEKHDTMGVCEVQLHTFYNWAKTAATAIRAGRRRESQVLVIAGPAGSGKSLLQQLVTLILGCRSADPYGYLLGDTKFNSHMFKAEHLMIEDRASSFDPRVRRHFGRELNALLMNVAQNCHPKHGEALTLFPHWWVTMTLNDEAENMMVLPPLDESLKPKMTILRGFKKQLPMPTQTDEQKTLFWDRLNAEMPRFIHFLLNEWTIPADMRDSRFGCTHYHHPELLELLDAQSPERRMLELIDAHYFPAGAAFWEAQKDKKAQEIASALTDKDSKYSFEARKLLHWADACGTYLGRLNSLYPNRIQRRTLHGANLWTIIPPEEVAEADE